ncbi:hypothetical protein ABIE62_000883 [Porphyrobacter sp. MBR-155]|jgi:hypothetical protein|uniref:hypothetical protein n=1 Tax=Porphyrobacter sp. MBR-155 TaxID=3156464 RepID=UPI00339B9897
MRVSLFTPEEFEQCRECIADIDMSDADKDELIRIVGNIVASFVDQSFGLHPVQLSLSARANRHFQNGRDDAILGLFQSDESIDPGDGGASNAPNGP